MDGPPILKEEVSAAIRKMKHGKAVGPDNIPIEVFTVLEDIGIDFLTKLLNSIKTVAKYLKTWQNLYSLLSLKYQVQWIVNYIEL